MIRKATDQETKETLEIANAMAEKGILFTCQPAIDEHDYRRALSLSLTRMNWVDMALEKMNIQRGDDQ